MRIIIDTNLYVSALTNDNSRQWLDALLLNSALILLINDTLLSELDAVMHRPKFRRYVSPAQIDQLMNLLLERATLIETVSKVQVSPDPKDDFLLALCRDGQADYLLTGNKLDLLALRQFDSTQIMTLTEFLTLHY